MLRYGGNLTSYDLRRENVEGYETCKKGNRVAAGVFGIDL